MKKIILGVVLATLLISCKEETKEKLENARDAVGSEMKEAIDSVKIKTNMKLDSVRENAKNNMDSVKIKSAARMEAAAKNLKESVKK